MGDAISIIYFLDDSFATNMDIFESNDWFYVTSATRWKIL